MNRLMVPTVKPAAILARLSGVLRPQQTPVLSTGRMCSAKVSPGRSPHGSSVPSRTRAVGSPGVLRGPQLHTLLPGGRAQTERWFSGLTREAQNSGAVLVAPHEPLIPTRSPPHESRLTGDTDPPGVTTTVAPDQ